MVSPKEARHLCPHLHFLHQGNEKDRYWSEKDEREEWGQWEYTGHCGLHSSLTKFLAIKQLIFIFTLQNLQFQNICFNYDLQNIQT